MKQKTKTILLGTVVLGLLVGIVLAARWYQQEYQLAVSTSFVMDTVVEQKLYGRIRSRRSQRSSGVCSSMSSSTRCT